jgi:hypothetical protein
MTTDPRSYEHAMWDAVSELDRAEAAALAARERAERATNDYGAALMAAEEPVPHEVINRLYWKHRNLRVAVIALAFGIEHPGAVHRYAGPGRATAPCPGVCGREVELPARTSSPTLCEACQRELQDRLEASSAIAQQRAVEHERALRARFRAGETPEQVYAEYGERYETGNPLRRWREIAAEELAATTGRSAL